MEATKIDIKTELLDIQNRPYVYFHEAPELDFLLNEDQLDYAERINIKVKKYKVYELIEGGKSRKYLLQQNEERIFNDLLQISNDDLDSMCKKAVKRAIENGKSLYLPMFQ